MTSVERDGGRRVDILVEAAARRLYEAYRGALRIELFADAVVNEDVFDCAAAPWEHLGAEHRAAWLATARLQRQAPKLHVIGVATDDDFDRALAFFDAWGLSDGRGEDAVRALGQAFADERATTEDEARFLGDELARAGIRLRRAVGVIADLSCHEGEIRAVLDDFAQPPKGSPCGAPLKSRDPRRAHLVDGTCGLLRGHLGPCGVTR